MDLEIGQVPITAHSPFAGKTIENSCIRQDRRPHHPRHQARDGMPLQPRA